MKFSAFNFKIVIKFKKVFKYIVILSSFLGILILGEAIYFYQILSRNFNPEKADLIVVFPGAPGRIPAAYDLLQNGYADNLAAPGITLKNLKRYDKKYGSSHAGKHILDNKSRTTFEDALYARLVVEKNDFKSIILVTSNYHLPRSYFLLRTLLTGFDVDLKIYGVAKNDDYVTSLLKTSWGRKMIINEMAKFWVSLFEMVSYKITGKLLSDNPIAMSVMKSLKS